LTPAIKKATQQKHPKIERLLNLQNIRTLSFLAAACLLLMTCIWAFTLTGKTTEPFIANVPESVAIKRLKAMGDEGLVIQYSESNPWHGRDYPHWSIFPTISAAKEDVDLLLIKAAPYLRKLTGNKVVNLYGTNLTNAGLKAFVGVSDIRVLSLSTSKVSDEGILALPNLQTLKEIEFDNTQITDKALKHLAMAKDLESIIAFDSKLTGLGFEAFTQHEHLDALLLSGSKIDRRGLRAISKLKTIKSLRLGRMPINDDDISLLKELTQLESLLLQETEITDKGVEHLKDLIHLNHLWLDGTRVTDACLVHLSQMKDLRSLRYGKRQDTISLDLRKIPNND